MVADGRVPVRDRMGCARYHSRVSLLPTIPYPLTEASAAALEWPRLREHVAGYTGSLLGRAWVLALEASADAEWIETQQQRTAEVREFLRSGGAFEFAGLFDPTELLEQARIEGTALEGVQINALLGIVEKLAAWKEQCCGVSKLAVVSWSRVSPRSTSSNVGHHGSVAGVVAAGARRGMRRLC